MKKCKKKQKNFWSNNVNYKKSYIKVKNIIKKLNINVNVNINNGNFKFILITAKAQ